MKRLLSGYDANTIGVAMVVKKNVVKYVPTVCPGGGKGGCLGVVVQGRVRPSLSPKKRVLITRPFAPSTLDLKIVAVYYGSRNKTARRCKQTTGDVD